MVAPDRLPLPAEGVTFDVACRTAPGDAGRTHPVTVTSDWRLVTPHDLAAERVAVALGGVSSCVELADRTLPAVRGYLTHRLRWRPADIVHAGGRTWRPTELLPGCCGSLGFPQARDAAGHLRRPKHWAQRYGASPVAVTALAQTLLDAVAAGDVRLADQQRDPACPPPAHADALGPAARAVCWDAGLHPSDAAAWAERLIAAGQDADVRAILEAAYAAPQAPGAAAPRLRRTRAERAAWLDAGVPVTQVTVLLAGDAYVLEDARVLAARLGRGVPDAAAILARWQASGLTPAVDRLVGLHWGPMPLDDPPPGPLLDRTLALAASRDIACTREDAALALVRTGTPDAAVTLLADPDRRVDDPYYS